MDSERIESRFEKIFAQSVGTRPADLSKPKNEIPAWDSLRHAQLIIDLQKEFQIVFSVAEILSAQSYFQLLECVKKKAFELNT